MTIEELKMKKKELGLSNQMVANISGVPLGTVQKVFGNITRSPRYETLKMLERALFPENFGGTKIKGAYWLPEDPYENMRVAEDSLAYQYEKDPYGIDPRNYDNEYSFNGKKQGKYTFEDVMKLPEGLHVELIDGRIYDMAPPTVIHQYIISAVFSQIDSYINARAEACIPMLSPVGVKLDANDNSNFLEPDIIVVCDKSKIRREMICGAPDFIAEVLSPSTRARDMFIKMLKYQQAGVREYWIIDPESRRITVHHFESLLSTDSYSFEDKVPVEITGNDLMLDFCRINNRLIELFGEDH